MKTIRLFHLCVALFCTLFITVACGGDELEPAEQQQQTKLDFQKEGEPSHVTRTATPNTPTENAEQL